MSLKSANCVETNKHELVVEVDGKTFTDAVNSVYRKEVKKISIPGFRKGKAPKAIIEKMYGEGVFYDDAIQNIYPTALADAVEEAKLDVVAVDDVSVEEVGKDGLTFKAVVVVKPEVEISDYEGIQVTPKSTEVTEELVNEEIDKQRDRNSRLVTVEDRPAQDGDITVIDFEGFVDGEAFEGGKAENFNLTLGSGQFIPGFEEQIVGKNTGDEFTIKVTFPEDYQVDELAGKESEFKIKLHEIKTKELPELDNDFVMDVSDKETVEEYKAQVTDELAEKLQKESDADVENQLVTKLCELLKGEIPEAMYDNKVNDMMREFDMRLRSQGLDMNTYLQYMGMDAEAVKNSYKPEAEKRVKLRLALEKIAQQEGFTDVSDEDLEAEYSRLAETYKMDIDKVKAAIAADELKKDIAVEKAMDFVKESAIANN
ncbi:trigger factor [Oscillospiraceae bacterium LCP25S3_E10]|nr:trigger factor [Ruminococcus sp.]MDD6446341.1 trigger factor [Ruminococcus sp.]MDY2856780.1 trigger factor [Oscillospiraceae bacterium]